MRQITVTYRGDKLPCLHCCCDNAACAYFVVAICRGNSNQFEFVRQITATMISACHTKQQPIVAMFGSNLLHSVSQP